MVDLSEEDIWELDKFQSNLGYRKQGVKIAGTDLQEDPASDCFIYEKRKGAFLPSEYLGLDRVASYRSGNLQLNKCDVYLLIPGKLDKIKNRFLFMLSAVTTIGMLGDIFYVFYQDQIGGTLSYIAAFVILAIIFGIYQLCMCVIDHIAKRGLK